jgi:hypothetical protein
MPQVERAFILWWDGAITIESIKRDKGKYLSLIRTLNATTGKESKDKAFNEANWGVVCREYLKSINSLHAGSLASIVEKAQKFVMLSQNGVDSSGTGETEFERGELIDISDDGRSHFISYTITEVRPIEWSSRYGPCSPAPSWSHHLAPIVNIRPASAVLRVHHHVFCLLVCFLQSLIASPPCMLLPFISALVLLLLVVLLKKYDLFIASFI